MPKFFPSSPSHLFEAVAGKGLFIPPEGWNAQNFARHGETMILALARVAKITQRRAAPALAAKASAMFKSQVNDICEIVMRRTHGRRAAKVTFVVDVAQTWADAINQVLAEAKVEAVAKLMPDIQSVMAQGYSKTSVALAQEPANISRTVTIRSRPIAERITKIDETTRKRIVGVVQNSVANDLSVAQTVDAVKAAAPKIYGHRALTIARTELNNAWNYGTAAAFLESHTITHISVIGCEAREIRSPQYHEESTCNYPDLPVGEIEAFLEVGFHPNHTGNLIPSGFRNADGTDDPDQPRPAIIEESERLADEQARDAE